MAPLNQTLREKHWSFTSLKDRELRFLDFSNENLICIKLYSVLSDEGVQDAKSNYFKDKWNYFWKLMKKNSCKMGRNYINIYFCTFFHTFKKNISHIFLFIVRNHRNEFWTPWRMSNIFNLKIYNLKVLLIPQNSAKDWLV